MTDLLGPASANNAVTTRLAESRVFAALDTWFKPCSSPAAQDGTQIQAAFINGLLAQLRAAIRGNGQLAAGTGPIVPETNTDDTMLLKAVQSLIQRGQLNYAADQGVANAAVANLTPAPPEIPIGLPVLIAMAAPPTGASTLDLNGFGVLPIQRRNGQATIGGEWGAGDLVPFVRTAAGWQIEGLTRSDVPAAVVHVGDDISPVATEVSSFVAPAITSHQTDHVFVIGVAHACTGPATAYLYAGDTVGRPIVRNDFSPLQAGDWPQYARLMLIDNGTSLNLAGFTLPQIEALVTGSTTISATTQNYIIKNTDAGLTPLSVATPLQNVADISTIAGGFTEVTATSGFSAATAARVSGTCAFHNATSGNQQTGGTMRLGLYDNNTDGIIAYSPYIGCGGAISGLQTGVSVTHVFQGLDPTHNYSIVMLCQKGNSDGTNSIWDTSIDVYHNGTNS